MKKQNLSKIIIYQAPNGAIELKGDFDKETVWASLDQIATVFGRDKSVISRHIRNIFKEKELEKISTVAFFATVQKEGEREVERNIEYFNLDVLISVGYRVNSKVATEFRQWATQTLRQHITKGYTINKKVLQNNYTLFQNALLDIQKISQNKLTSNAVIHTPSPMPRASVFLF